MSTIRELLLLSPSQIHPRALTRAIAEHAEWYVPMLSFDEPGATRVADYTRFGDVILPPDLQLADPEGQLWMFTDLDAVSSAPRHIGFGTITGTELCANIPVDRQLAIINPGSDSITLKLPAQQRTEMGQFAAAISFERELAARGPDLAQAMVNHACYFVAFVDDQPVSVGVEDG
ncbi:MAG TPA: hypothetical protein VGC41_08645, partial [Kofleriaceae bacterium]